MAKNLSWLLSFAAVLQFHYLAGAADLTLKVVDKEPPKELDASIRAKLQSKAIQLLDGENPAYEFWFVSELPLSSKPESAINAFGAIPQAALLGAVSVSKSRRDYRDDEVSAGVFTMRYALQPQDGNHLGTAEHSFFALLVSAKIDTAPASITDYKKLVHSSSRGTASEHPVVISLRPAPSDDGELPKLNDPLPDHKSVRVRIPAKVLGPTSQVSVVFEVVYKGMGHK